MPEFTPEAVARIQQVVPHVERSMRNVRGHRGRWHGRGGAKERHFELKTAILSYATAHPLTWNGGWVIDTDADSEFEVYDILGMFRGRARNAYSSPHDQGSRGVARFDSARGVWRIVELQPHALMIRGQLTAALATTDTTFTIDGVIVLNPIGGIITSTDPAANVTVYNVHTWESDDNAECVATWNENDGRYDAIQVDCPA